MNQVDYQEFTPDRDIEDFVYCYWSLESTDFLNEPFSYRVVSDGCIDIFFNQNDLSEIFVMGFCRKYTQFDIGHSFKYFGIRFYPSAFPIIFNINAQSISNGYHHLSQVLPAHSSWIKNDLQRSNVKSIIHGFNSYLKKIILEGEYDRDVRFLNALELVFRKKGMITVEKDLQTGLSSRQLRRLFNYFLGTTAKTFCNVVRFQTILSARHSKKEVESQVYHELGFYDQAHFSKTFKTFYGVSPSKAFD